mgnify:CR=1 FL=1
MTAPTEAALPQVDGDELLAGPRRLLARLDRLLSGRWWLLIVVGLALAISILAAAPPRQPVLAYWVSHHDLPPALDRPWGEGFTNPRLVAYDDGLVIYAPDPMKGPSAVTLSASELSALLEASGSGFFELQDSYTGTKEMHPPVHLLTRWKGGTRKTVRFFGRTSEASDAPQTLLRAIEKTPFFQAVRRLTILGLIALPKYGGNQDYMGWKLLGVEDNHVWTPPFGYYDKDYPGFEPYPGTKPYMA